MAPVNALWDAIQEALARLNPGWIESIDLDNGAESLNLAVNADVRVTSTKGTEEPINVVTRDWMIRYLTDDKHFDECGSLGFLGSLIVVREITGESIVRSIVRLGPPLADG